MIGHYQGRPMVVMNASAQTCESCLNSQKVLRRDLAESDHQAGADQIELRPQICIASFGLCRLWRAISRGPAFHNVRDVDVFATLKRYGGQHVIEQPAGLTDKRLAALIFLRAGGFADKQPLCFFITDAKNGLLACLVESACGTGGDGRFQLSPIHGSNFRHPVRGRLRAARLCTASLTSWYINRYVR